MKISNNLTELIGNTPLLKLNNFMNNNNLKCNIIGKLESFNPLSSVKDRAAFSMIDEGQKDGSINKYTLLIEATSGNTGVALSYIAAARGMKLIIVMPDSMSIERRNLISAFGAELILTPGAKGMKGAIEKANEIHKQTPNSVIVGQFDNPANSKIHRETTGVEIWEDTDGTVDILICGVGTGGTITGAGEYLKSKNPNIKVIAVEPSASPVLSGGNPGPHKLQGIGAGFIPKILNVDIFDEVIKVDNEDGFATSKELAITEGLLVGISAGAAITAAKVVGNRPENVGKNIVVILPDTGERYLTTDLFK